MRLVGWGRAFPRKSGEGVVEVCRPDRQTFRPFPAPGGAHPDAPPRHRRPGWAPGLSPRRCDRRACPDRRRDEGKSSAEIRFASQLPPTNRNEMLGINRSVGNAPCLSFRDWPVGQVTGRRSRCSNQVSAAGVQGQAWSTRRRMRRAWPTMGPVWGEAQALEEERAERGDGPREERLERSERAFVPGEGSADPRGVDPAGAQQERCER